MLPRLWCHIYAHSAEVGSGVRGDQRVPDAPAQSGESHQGLSVLTVCQKAVAFKQGCLHIAKITKKSRIHSRVGIQSAQDMLAVCTCKRGAKLPSIATMLVSCAPTLVCSQGYYLGRSSLIEAILKNQFLHVSLPISGTWSEVKSSVAHTFVGMS